MATTKEAWEEVGDRLQALGLKLKLHAQEESAGDTESVRSALDRLAEAVEGAVEAIGDAAKDPAVKDDAKSAAEAFAKALRSTFLEAKAALSKE